MITPINSPFSAYGLSGANSQTTGGGSTTSEFVASFKDIMSTMMLSGGGSSMGMQSGSSMTDMMTPLLMIILLERLVELQMEGGSSEKSGTQNALNLNPKSEPSGRPVGGVLTQDYHPGHNGLDFGIVVGTPVETTMDGKVAYAGWNNQGYGNLVIVENGDYKTYYAHLSSIPVSVGDTVTAGTTIGLSGNTGNSTGPHLHYEIRKNNVPIDPTAATLGA